MPSDEQLTAAINELLANRDAVLADAKRLKGDAFAAELDSELTQLQSLLAEGSDASDAVSLLAMQAMLSTYETSALVISELQESYAALMHQILTNIR